MKEKVIAAHRARIKTVILPKNNKKDLEDIRKEVLSDLKFVFVDHIDQVLKIALVNPLERKEEKLLSANINRSLTSTLPS